MFLLRLDRSHRRAVRLLAATARSARPPFRWHPVVWMGKVPGLARRSHRSTRSPGPPPIGGHSRQARWPGTVARCSLAGRASALQSSLLRLAVELIGRAAARRAPQTLFSWRMLPRSGGGGGRARALAARGQTATSARLVSRDVVRLTLSQVRESAIESLAENLNDSVVAPSSGSSFAGLPGAVVYRFANTADAMWGYRHMRARAVLGMGGEVGRASPRCAVVAAGRVTALLLAPWQRAVFRCASCNARPGARPHPTADGPWPRWRWPWTCSCAEPGVYALHEAGAQAQAVDTRPAVQLATRSVASCGHRLGGPLRHRAGGPW